MTMKISLVSAFLLVMGAAPVTGHANETTNASPKQSRIESKLKKDADLKDVHVKCDEVVTLTGKVASESDRMRAERLASASGATRIDNQIEVDGSLAKARIDDRADAAKDRVQTRGDIEKNRIDRRAELAKDRAENKDEGDTKPSVGDDVSDTWITTKLKSKYTTESAFKGASIHVETDGKGTVSLSGSVPSPAAHVKALEVARATKGVRDVHDELQVVANAP